jgi:hypothetical protein
LRGGAEADAVRRHTMAGFNAHSCKGLLWLLVGWRLEPARKPWAEEGAAVIRRAGVGDMGYASGCSSPRPGTRCDRQRTHLSVRRSSSI